MSCDKCDKAQESGRCTFVRVGCDNILVSGCDKHLKMLFEQLNNGVRLK